MEIMGIQHRLADLEARYHGLCKLIEVDCRNWQDQGSPLKGALEEMKVEAELALLQLLQVEDELRHYFSEFNQLKLEYEQLGQRKKMEREEKEELARKLKFNLEALQGKEAECQRKDEKLAWLRSQRQLLIDLIKHQFRLFLRFSILSHRFRRFRGLSTRQDGQSQGL